MQFTSMILSNAEVSPGYWRMRMTAPQEFASAVPGQFVMVRVSGAIDPLLRRPFGIFDVGVHTPAQSGAVSQPCFEMLYRVVGKGTALLSTLHETDLLDILGPLGPGDPGPRTAPADQRSGPCGRPGRGGPSRRHAPARLRRER